MKYTLTAKVRRRIALSRVQKYNYRFRLRCKVCRRVAAQTSNKRQLSQREGSLAAGACVCLRARVAPWNAGGVAAVNAASGDPSHPCSGGVSGHHHPAPFDGVVAGADDCVVVRDGVAGGAGDEPFVCHPTGTRAAAARAAEAVRTGPLHQATSGRRNKLQR